MKDFNTQLRISVAMDALGKALYLADMQVVTGADLIEPSWDDLDRSVKQSYRDYAARALMDFHDKRQVGEKYPAWVASDALARAQTIARSIRMVKR